MFFLRRRQLVKYAEHDRNFYDSTRMLNFKVCLRLQISNYEMQCMLQINCWWSAARQLSRVERMLVGYTCDCRSWARDQETC